MLLVSPVPVFGAKNTCVDKQNRKERRRKEKEIHSLLRDNKHPRNVLKISKTVEQPLFYFHSHTPFSVGVIKALS